MLHKQKVSQLSGSQQRFEKRSFYTRRSPRSTCFVGNCRWRFSFLAKFNLTSLLIGTNLLFLENLTRERCGVRPKKSDYFHFPPKQKTDSGFIIKTFQSKQL